jgi:mRNA degradation ribonuclease J1/J2
VAELDAGGAIHKRERVAAGRVHVFNGRAIAPSVLRDRLALAGEGVAIVIVSVDAKGALASEPIVTTRGVIDEEADSALLAEAKREVRTAIADLPKFLGIRPIEDSAIVEAARSATRRAFARALGFKPMTVATVLRVSG